MYSPCSENKGADQLRGYREADLRLCFRIWKNPVFSRRGSYIVKQHFKSECSPGAVARSVGCLLLKQRSLDRTSRPSHSFVEKIFPFYSDSRSASCWALNSGKLPQEWPKNCVVKYI